MRTRKNLAWRGFSMMTRKEQADLIHKHMLTLNEELQALRDERDADQDEPNDPVETERKYGQYMMRTSTEVGTTLDFRVPEIYHDESQFGTFEYLATSLDYFSIKDIKTMEVKLKRKLDKYDTICVTRPNADGVQGLVVIRQVKLSDAINLGVETYVDEFQPRF
ncbi:hypothetical protein PYW08_008613 [Mythimna loreyi]|uniref:Uncharacterized protein n=1 Tax=Mythimna loreyi TaxID=667449 RepID=A0ACC2QA55_9NEOP|nr:hypothetical protein PYW08_008613 [Mythimna loreyi]